MLISSSFTLFESDASILFAISFLSENKDIDFRYLKYNLSNPKNKEYYKKGIMHCYSYSTEIANELKKLGFIFGLFLFIMVI